MGLPTKKRRTQNMITCCIVPKTKINLQKSKTKKTTCECRDKKRGPPKTRSHVAGPPKHKTQPHACIVLLKSSEPRPKIRAQENGAKGPKNKTKITFSGTHKALPSHFCHSEYSTRRSVKSGHTSHTKPALFVSRNTPVPEYIRGFIKIVTWRHY